MTKRILERINVIEGFPPVDLSSGANTGDWVSLKQYARVAVMFHSGLGTAAQDPPLTILQATAVAGTGSKALDFTTIYTKQAATSLAAVGVWTKVTQTASNTYTEATSAEQDALWVVEFQDSDLDVDNDFDCISATVADVGTAAQVGTLHYILADPKYATAPELMQSAIVD